MKLARSPLATLLLVALLGVVPRLGLHAQESAAAAPEASNFVHPPGTETVPLGSLGGVVRRGHGPIPMLLITGAAFEGAVWEPFMERNADRYTMYAITRAGSGDTPPPPMPEDPEDFTRHTWNDAFVDGVLQLVRDEDLERPVVVGHHLQGDHIALRLGLEHPDLFRGVVVISGVPSRPSGDGTIDEQIAAVEERWKPFFREVTLERWLQGTYQPERLSVNPERGRELFEYQRRTPLPNQIRYYLEYLTTNTALDLPELQLPLLVVVQKPAELEAWLENLAANNAEASGMAVEEAREQIEVALRRTYGSLEEAEIAVLRPWTRFRDQVADLRIEYVSDTGIFIMDDRPERLDEILVGFVNEL